MTEPPTSSDLTALIQEALTRRPKRRPIRAALRYLLNLWRRRR